jgi:putative tricarboxylic transport membrane protein
LAITLVITAIQHVRHSRAARSTAPKFDADRLGV